MLDRIDAADHVLVGFQILPGQFRRKADVRVDEKQVRVAFLAQELVGDEVARPGDETFLTGGQKPGLDALLFQEADHLDERAHVIDRDHAAVARRADHEHGNSLAWGVRPGNGAVRQCAS
jgi:hypothetical protein